MAREWEVGCGVQAARMHHSRRILCPCLFDFTMITDLARIFPLSELIPGGYYLPRK
jgi:hypothetical protein